MSCPLAIDVGFKLLSPLLWQIHGEEKDMSVSSLAYNLDICYWEREGTDDWNLSPRACLANPEKEISHFQLIEKANLQFPIILYHYQGQWIILDGVHRFAKAWKEGKSTILAKCLTFEQIAPFLREKGESYFLLQKAPFPFSEMIMQESFSLNLLKEIKKQSYFPAKLYKNFFLKHAYRLSESELLQANKHHKRGADFFSASYSGEWLFLGIGKSKIGVDIEVIKPRSKELLEKHTLELRKYFTEINWKYFYLLRTGKEVVLKASDSENLDLIETIQLIKIEKSSEQIGTITFDWNLSFHFQGRVWLVKSGENGEIAYSVCEK